MIIRPSGDTLLLVELDAAIDPAINQRVVSLAERLQTRLGTTVRDVVPGYGAVGIHYDPLRTDVVALERAIVEAADESHQASESVERAIIEIPVNYGGAAGPDLEDVAAWAGCSADEVVARHSEQVYRVYMLGFVPGFAYLGRVDRRIAAPRRRAPRERVPPGSVGIAGEQTGVYPMTTPGGWQLVGRTDVVMFDAARAAPSLLRPGDRVRFVAVAHSG